MYVTTIAACANGQDSFTIGAVDDGYFFYEITENRRDVSYADAFCTSDSQIVINKKATYIIGSATPFSLEAFSFSFRNATAITVDLMINSGLTQQYRVGTH